MCMFLWRDYNWVNWRYVLNDVLLNCEIFEMKLRKMKIINRIEEKEVSDSNCVRVKWEVKVGFN